MTDNTDVYWEANGISLHTMAWSVETKAGRMASPAKRGDDFVLPFRTGRVPTRKLREARMQHLPMWVGPFDEDGTDDPSMSKKAKTEQNWNHLMDKLAIDGRFPLVKRFYDNGDVVVVTGEAELLEPPDITVSSKTIWRFMLDLWMADPWFYGESVEAEVGTIDVEGNASTDRVTIEMPNGRITAPDGNWIQYNGSGLVVVDCREGLAMQGSTPVNGLMERNPKFPEWLTLQPGVNAFVGSGTLTYYPAYK